jgi:DNA repair exonuclease SbcCD ATPase subunit
MSIGIFDVGLLKGDNHDMDGTEIKQDVTSADNQETSKQVAQTFTKEQVEKLKSDALAAAGREAKTLEARRAELDKREAEINATLDKIHKLEEERELAELEGLTQDPKVKQTLTEYKNKLAERTKELAKKEAELKARESEFSSRFEKATKAELENTINTIAKEKNVDIEVLRDKVAKLNITDVTSISEIASIMPKIKDVPKPDSGKNTGAGVDISKMSSRELITEGLKKINKR